MSWNYRVIYHHEEQPGESWHGIHEVYYAEDNDDHPVSYKTDHIGVMSTEGIEGLGWVLDRMREALAKPVLTPGDFPKPENEPQID